MIKYTFTLTLLISIFHLNAQVCNPFSFSSQAAIDQFIINNPTCTEIGSNLYITGQGITNLQGLKNIKKIKGNLTITSTSLSNLNDLIAIESTGGLVLSNNNILSDVSGWINYSASYGDIIIQDNDIMNSIQFPTLTSVEGFVIDNNVALGSAMFNNLERIDGKLSVKNGDLLNTLAFPKLNTIDGDVEMINMKKLDNLELSNLDSIIGALTIYAGTLKTLNLPHVTYLKGLMNVDGLVSCNQISIPNLTSYQGNMDISLPALLNLDMKSLKLISGNCYISNNENLLSFNFASLEKIDGEITISHNAAIAFISLNQLTKLASNLKIESNARLSSIEIIKMDSIKGRIDINRNGNLNNVLFNSLKFTNNFICEFNFGKLSIQLPLLNSVKQFFQISKNSDLIDLNISSLRESSAFTINDNSKLKNIILPNFKKAYDFQISNNASLKYIDMAIDSVNRTLTITDNTILDSINATNLKKVNYNIVIQRNPMLTYIDFRNLINVNNDAFFVFPKVGQYNMSNLKSVKNTLEFNCLGNYEFFSLEQLGRLVVKSSTTLAEISMPKLKIANSLELSYNKSLKHFLIPNVDSVGLLYLNQNDSLIDIISSIRKANFIQIIDNGLLSNIDFANLTSSSIFVDGNKSLTSLSLSSLVQSSDVSIGDNAKLTTLVIDNIKNVSGSFECSTNQSLIQINLPMLEGVGSYLRIIYNTILENLNFPKLIVVGNMIIEGNATLSNCVVPTLTSVNSIRLYNNPKLLSFIADKVARSHLNIESNAKLINVSLKSLSEANLVYVFLNKELMHLELNQLKAVNTDIYFGGNDKLMSISFPALTQCLGQFYIVGQNISKLNVSSINEIGKKCTIGASKIDSIIMPNLEKIGTDLMVSNLPNLTDVAMPKLSKIGGSFVINNCTKLVSLAKINSLRVNQFTGSNWYISITNNKLLSFCNVPFLCEAAILFPTKIYINSNAPGCNEENELSCTNLLVSGRIFYDINKNGIQDNNEFAVPYAKVMDEESNITYFCDEYGVFKFAGLENTKYKLSALLPENMTISSTPLVYEFVYTPGQGNYSAFNFGVHYKNEIEKLEVNVANNLMRCNSEISIVVSYLNSGSETINGYLEINMDDRITYLSASEQPLKIQGNIIEWKINNLDPYELNEIVIKAMAPSEAFTGKIVSIGGIVYADAEHKNELSRSSIEKEVRCSFDPNDKAVSPFSPINENPTPFMTPLQYTIRFQNTGNDVAYNIEIRDTLDTNLDLATFKVIKSSFAVNTSMSNNHVSFKFNDINLPSEKQNEPASHGYVIYAISPNSNLSASKQIFNKAGIYFDSNPPIITNEVVSTLIETSTDDITKSSDCYLQPNIDSYEICIINRNPSFRPIYTSLYNASGVFIKDINTSCLNISDFSNGMYFIKIYDYKKSETLKFVKK